MCPRPKPFAISVSTSTQESQIRALNLQDFLKNRKEASASGHKESVPVSLVTNSWEAEKEKTWPSLLAKSQSNGEKYTQRGEKLLRHRKQMYAGKERNREKHVRVCWFPVSTSYLPD